MFTTCMDMMFKDLDDHFTTYPDLTVAQGQICLRPVTGKYIMAFVQWTWDELLLGCEPNLTSFPAEQVSDLIRRL
jgi:hypothetical protein